MDIDVTPFGERDAAFDGCIGRLGLADARRGDGDGGQRVRGPGIALRRGRGAAGSDGLLTRCRMPTA